jgi:hypothetical protein
MARPKPLTRLRCRSPADSGATETREVVDGGAQACCAELSGSNQLALPAPAEHA